MRKDSPAPTAYGDVDEAQAQIGVARAQAAETQQVPGCLLYTSDAADERSSVDLGGRRIIKKKNTDDYDGQPV